MDAEAIQQLQDKVYAAKRLLKIEEARGDLKAFIELMMPDEEFPNDPDRTEYQDAPHCRLYRSIIRGLEDGSCMRTAVSIPPQHGKTIHLSTFGPAWLLGRNPKLKMVIATYNESRASELGDEFRKVVQSDIYKAIFPDVVLSKGSESMVKIGTTKKGRVFFVSTGGTVTGRTAQIFIIDDPIKDDEELQNDATRDKKWKWFFSVAYSRGSKRTPILILHTRWHADDLIGRLCDPDHPERERMTHDASTWTYLNISGVVEDPNLAEALGLELTVPTDPKIIKAFGEKPMAALWEEDKDLAHFAEWKAGEPLTFSALVMGKPTIEDGEYFHADDLIEYYSADDIPVNARKYGASDHAVSEDQRRDYTCLGSVAIDEHSDIWVLPDLFWDQVETDRTVEELLYQFKTHRPELWFMESELISKSFGPFLKKRMIETNTYSTLQPITRTKDKKSHARAIQGRIQNRKVHFPAFAPWWQKARSQMLQFNRGANDDFVDFMANLGQGLMHEISASPAKTDSNVVHLSGSPQWILQQSRRRATEKKRESASAGW